MLYVNLRIENCLAIFSLNTWIVWYLNTHPWILQDENEERTRKSTRRVIKLTDKSQLLWGLFYKRADGQSWVPIALPQGRMVIQYLHIGGTLFGIYTRIQVWKKSYYFFLRDNQFGSHIQWVVKLRLEVLRQQGHGHQCTIQNQKSVHEV